MLTDVKKPEAGLMVRLPVVAIVDDDPAVCNSLKFALELEGFSVSAYGSATELLDAGNFDSVNCFVIDQAMPVMTGLELIGKLRQMNLNTPAILLVSSPNNVVRARAAMARVAVIEKPLLSNALVDRIREACERRA